MGDFNTNETTSIIEHPITTIVSLILSVPSGICLLDGMSASIQNMYKHYYSVELETQCTSLVELQIKTITWRSILLKRFYRLDLLSLLRLHKIDRWNLFGLILNCRGIFSIVREVNRILQLVKFQANYHKIRVFNRSSYKNVWSTVLWIYIFIIYYNIL